MGTYAPSRPRFGLPSQSRYAEQAAGAGGSTELQAESDLHFSGSHSRP